MHTVSLGRLHDHIALAPGSVPATRVGLHITLSSLRHTIASIISYDDSYIRDDAVELLDITARDLATLLDVLLQTVNNPPDENKMVQLEQAIHQLTNTLALDFQNAVAGAKNTEAREKLQAAEREKADLQKTVQTITTEAAQDAVRIHAEKFEQFRVENALHAEFWANRLIAIAGLAVVLVMAETHFLSDKADPTTTTIMLLHEVTPRALIVSICFFALVFAARNYSAARHNQMVNGRRAAALDSFDSFFKATASEKELQMEVLKQVTAAIFSDQTTGYLIEKPVDKQIDSTALKTIKDAAELAIKNAKGTSH
jgi:hypothetical protein